jgi:hypothetical protein
MPKKPSILIALLVLAGGIFVYANRDWFKARPIQITHRFYAFGGRFDNGGGEAPLLFEFDRLLKLTSVKVVLSCEAQTNKLPHALWSLVSETNSVPTRGFVYGRDIPGMHRVYKGVSAEALDPEQKYRVLVEAGSVKGQHDFDLDPSPH